MPGERARADQLVLHPAVRVQRERQRRPRRRRADVRAPSRAEPSRSREPRRAAHGLDEPRAVGTDLRIGPEHRVGRVHEPHAVDGHVAASAGARDEAAVDPVTHDPTVVDLDPCTEGVRERERVRGQERVEIIDPVGGREVEPHEPELERETRGALDRLSRHPGHREHGALHPDRGPAHRPPPSIVARTIMARRCRRPALRP